MAERLNAVSIDAPVQNCMIKTIQGYDTMLGSFIRSLRSWLLRRFELDVDESSTKSWWEVDLLIVLLMGVGILGAVALIRLQ